MTTSEVPTLYERVGGFPWFAALVERFYARVESDPVLRPVYPEDLGPGKAHLALFLAQFWGGPPDYDATRGAPMLRLRHLPFTIGPRERDVWVAHMTAAVKAAGLDAADEARVLDYFEKTATAMVNRLPEGHIPLRPA